MKKKMFILLLTLAMLFSINTPVYAGEETIESFDIALGNGQHITAAVLVENGVARSLTENEYLDVVEEYISTNDISLENHVTQNGNSVGPRVTYSFTPTVKMMAYAGARRVSPIYSNATSLSVTNSTTFTRTATETGGVSVTSGISSVVDAKVSATYGLSISATSANGSSVTATFSPSGNYTYSAVVFSPRIAIIKGTLKSGSKSYDMTWHYPVKSSNGILDGVYTICESDNVSQFPDMG